MTLTLAKFSRCIWNDIGIGTRLKKTEALEKKIKSKEQESFDGFVHTESENDRRKEAGLFGVPLEGEQKEESL